MKRIIATACMLMLLLSCGKAEKGATREEKELDTFFASGISSSGTGETRIAPKQQTGAVKAPTVR